MSGSSTGRWPRRRGAAGPEPVGGRPRRRSARTASTSSAETPTAIRRSASEVRRAECPAKLACDSIPDCTEVVCDAAGRGERADLGGGGVRGVLEDHRAGVGPGSSASCGARPVASGSSSAPTRAATSDADCAIAPRSESSASVRMPAWKLPFGQRDAVARQHQRVLARDVELDSRTAKRRSRASSSVPSTCGTQRNTNASWIARAPALAGSGGIPIAEQLAQAAGDLHLPVMGPRGVHARVEHREVGAGRLVGERGHAEGGVEQPASRRRRRATPGRSLTALELMKPMPSRGP